MTLNTSRRGFLKGAAAASAVLLVGARPDGALAAGSSQSAMLNPFVKISSDGLVLNDYDVEDTKEDYGLKTPSDHLSVLSTLTISAKSKSRPEIVVGK